MEANSAQAALLQHPETPVVSRGGRACLKAYT